MRGPKPVDPLYWRINGMLSVRCPGCRNRASASVRAWVVWHRLDDRMTFSAMRRRMICLRCGRYGPEMDLRE